MEGGLGRGRGSGGAGGGGWKRTVAEAGRRKRRRRCHLDARKQEQEQEAQVLRPKTSAGDQQPVAAWQESLRQGVDGQLGISGVVAKLLSASHPTFSTQRLDGPNFFPSIFGVFGFDNIILTFQKVEGQVENEKKLDIGGFYHHMRNLRFLLFATFISCFQLKLGHIRIWSKLCTYNHIVWQHTHQTGTHTSI